MIALISGKSADPAEIRQKALRSGYSFEVSHQALCLNFRGRTGEPGDRGHPPGGGGGLPRLPAAALSGLPFGLHQRESCWPSCRSCPALQRRWRWGRRSSPSCGNAFPRAVFYIGIGKRYRKLEGFSDSIYESELAARALRSLGRDNQARRRLGAGALRAFAGHPGQKAALCPCRTRCWTA